MSLLLENAPKAPASRLPVDAGASMGRLHPVEAGACPGDSLSDALLEVVEGVDQGALERVNALLDRWGRIDADARGKPGGTGKRGADAHPVLAGDDLPSPLSVGHDPGRSAPPHRVRRAPEAGEHEAEPLPAGHGPECRHRVGRGGRHERGQSRDRDASDDPPRCAIRGRCSGREDGAAREGILSRYTALVTASMFR